MKKYIVYGGYVISAYDKQRHYINAYTVSRLYKVNPYECIFIETNREDRDKLRGLNISDYKVLYPRYDGNYKLD